MNYYMPYTNINPYLTSLPTKTGLLNKIFKNGINWGTILTNTQKTLNIINQALPVIKQVGPVVNNAKTMFKVMNEFKKIDTPTKETKINNTQENKIIEKTINEENTNNPIFFL